MIRAIITALTVMYLAFAAQTALSYLVTSGDAVAGPIAIEATARDTTGATTPHLWMQALIVDGKALRWEAADQITGWGVADHQTYPAYLEHKQEARPGIVKFRGKRFTAVVQLYQWSGVIVIKRNGRTTQEISVQPSQTALINLEDPTARGSAVMFFGTLALFVGCAWWFGPLRPGRGCVIWLVLFLGTLHLLYWASHPVATTGDSVGYIRSVPQLLAGVPAYYPPGYPAFLWFFRGLAGEYLGSLVTLFQHALVVVAAVWLYRIMREIVSEGLAFAGAVIAGAVSPALTAPQAVTTEATTYFAIVGSLYCALRSTRNRSVPFMAMAGVLAGGAGTLRVVPIVALLPAFCLIYLSDRRLQLRPLAITLTAAVVTLSIPLLWFWAKSGRPLLADSAGYHIFNRVIIEQQHLDEYGPATRELLVLLSGKDPRVFSDHSQVREQAKILELGWHKSELLMRQVALEGIYKNPWSYLAYTPYLAFRTLLVPTNFLPPWPDTNQIEPVLENAPLLACTEASIAWRQTLDETNRVLWPTLCWLAIAGTLAGLAGRQRLLILALAWVPVGYLLASAAVENFCPRYNASVVPLVAILAMIPLDLVQKALRRELSRFLGAQPQKEQAAKVGM
jgi:Dolichyl-phosphate-mannose-protein mannosyltransferase